jgi:Uma2 family endonuclease
MAPGDVLFSQFDVVEPDALFVATANAPRLRESHVEGAPDLAIEVLSPSSVRIDRVRKLSLFERHGVREYWLANPATDTLEVYRLTDEGRLTLRASLSHAAGDVLETPLLAGLRIALSEIFS